MNTEEIKQEIEQRTGVPAAFLTGETTEAIIAQAKALLAFKLEQEDQREKSTAEQFAIWLQAQNDEEPHDAAGAALEALEEDIRVDRGGYPVVRDGGEMDHAALGDGRSALEQFRDYVYSQLAFNPFSDHGKNKW